MRVKRVFVLEAHLPNGGTYMAYSLGSLVQQHWDFIPVNVVLATATRINEVWDYDVEFQTMELSEMLQCATEEDILIANPSFSDHMLGLSFPGIKLMYVQGLNTFRVIDGFFDKYVAVSPFVQQFLADIYGLDVPVIQPFLHHDHMVESVPSWTERPEGSVLTMNKFLSARLLKVFEAEFQKLYGDLPFSITVLPKGLPHRKILEEMSKHRFFLWLSPIEGFGLPPLEAMLCGCTVVGFHGCGGQAYFEHDKNALVCSYPDIGELTGLFAKALSNQEKASRLALAGRQTASRYTVSAFQRSWVEELIPLLGPVQHGS
jgi:hypothetical protein